MTHYSHKPTYRIIQTTLIGEDNIPYTAYGISCCGSVLTDISCNQSLVEKTVDLFNLCALPYDLLNQTVANILS